MKKIKMCHFIDTEFNNPLLEKQKKSKTNNKIAQILYVQY